MSRKKLNKAAATNERQGFLAMGFALNLKPSTLNLKAFYLALVFSLSALSLNAQIYPVQVTPVLVPPYTLNTSDYYNGTFEKLAIVLTNTDLQKPVLSVRLRMYIEGQNAKLQSRDGVYYPTITLDAGIPQRISLKDLAPYFNIDNLNFSGITRAMYAQNAKLPEGFYSFCFEVIEVNTGKVLSRKSCSMAYITLSDPPLLNLPIKGESIASREVQNIIFQWTPRNMGSPNGAFNTEYEFTLKELWDTGIAPEAAFMSSQPLYQTTVRQTTLLMGPAEPQLIPGKRYAWRVRAVSTSPTGEQADSYRNNGFSEIYWFTYQSDCRPPLSITSSVTGGRATINWLADATSGGTPAGGYTLQYRERSLSGSKWYSVNTLENRAMLYDLKPGTTYEYRVGSSCVAGNIGIGTDQATYSDLLTLEINGNPNDTATVNCGMIGPEIAINNRTPIQVLNQGDLIMAGGFPVKLTKVSGGGSFSGEGYVTIPMLGQVNVKVRFSGIQVNTERQLFAGVIETTYDVKETQIVDVKEIYDDIKELVTGIIDKLKDLLKNPTKNKNEIAKAEKEFGSEYAKMVNELPISDAEKKERLAVYEELSKQVYLASNSSGIDEATIQAAGASKKLDELKESVKSDLANAETINKKLAAAIDYDKLIKWLIDNKGKVVSYDYTNFISKEFISSTSSLGVVSIIPIDKSYTTSVDGVQKTFHLKGNLSVKKGNVDLSANHKVYSSISILPNQDKIQYTLNYNYESSDERAIRLETNNTEEMEYLFIAQGFSYTEPYKKTVTDRFIGELKLAGTDCDKLDYLYENIPSFVPAEISDGDKWIHLKAMGKCRIDEIGTNENKAILNLIGSISVDYLKEKIDKEPIFFMDLYHNLSGSWKARFTAKIVKLLDATWNDVTEPITIFPNEMVLSMDGSSTEFHYISCFSITNNQLSFGKSGWNVGNLGKYDDTGCINYKLIAGSLPVIVRGEVGGERIVIPAFIAGEVMRSTIKASEWRFLSDNLSLLMPELLISKGRYAGWGKYLKGEQVANNLEKATLLTKLNNYPNLKGWINTLNEVADANLLSKIDNFTTVNPNKIEKFENLLNAPKLKQQNWDNLESVFDAFKKVEDKGISGLSIGHKKFPTIDDEGSGSFILNNAKQYQLEASGDAALSFEKAGVSFDNLDDAGKLIDRKYGHGASIFKEVDNGLGDKIILVINQNRANSILTQARNQVAAAGSTPIKWEISTELGAKGIRELFKTNGINIEVVFEAQIKIIN